VVAALLDVPEGRGLTVSIEADLEVLEQSIRQLGVDWEKFFAGIDKRPPNELKARVEALVRKHAYSEIRNNALRFRYQTLVARYNTFSELWSKRLRAKEEGRPVGVHGRLAEKLEAAAIAAAPQAHASHEPRSKSDQGEYRIRDAGSDSSAVRGLFERFLEARTVTGESANVKFESFQKLIAQQAARILEQKGALAVDFRLETKDGKVSLKAKPVK
jgi:hypothetical protein